MKNLKITAGILWLIGIVAFCMWNRNNANGFWWTGFVCFSAVIAAGTLTSVFEKGWIRVFRIASALGVLLNGIVVTSNGGRMPVIIEDSSRAITGLWRHAAPSDHFLFLCDRISLGFGTFSIGDCFLYASLIALVFVIKGNKKGEKWLRYFMVRLYILTKHLCSPGVKYRLS